MASTTIAFHVESNIGQDGRANFFIMGPSAPGGGPVADIKAYTIYPIDTEWDASVPLPVIYDGLTIDKARLAICELDESLRE